MRHKNETTDFARRTSRKDEPSATPEPLRTVDNEEWAWMVDEDPAFYLSKSEAAGA